MKLKTYLLLICSLLLSLKAPIVMAIEEPSYQVLKQSESFELRQYESQLIAEVTVQGSLSEASNKGFRLVADYIFGNNQVSQASSNQSEKIAMTAPVVIEPQSSKIAMTAPVVVEKKGASEQQQWTLYFVMPKSYRMDNLPKPNNPQVQIKEIKNKKVAVIRFSGWVDEEKLADRTAELQTWMKQEQLIAIGEPQLARYNPPWTLPWWRRNEVFIPVQ
jgi:SOUL heme-binding protein